MTQIYEKFIFKIDLDEIKQKPTKEAKEDTAKKFSGISNPRFYEETISIKRAKQKYYAKYGMMNITDFNR